MSTGHEKEHEHRKGRNTDMDWNLSWTWKMSGTNMVMDYVWMYMDNKLQ
jgi:hypothetical protein